MTFASSQGEAKLGSVFKTSYATRERENRSHFLYIFPIDTPQKVCYNWRREHVPCERRISSISQVAPVCQAKLGQKIAQKISRNQGHFCA
jgi:hypothetical protein